MKITTFRNMKGIIWGGDPKRICCDKSGALKIGNTDIKVTAGENCVMPQLFYGATGSYSAKYITNEGVFTLADVTVRNGLILPPSSTAVELMELTCRADTAEREREEMREELEELKHIFDTDSLNFILKPQGE